MGMSLTDTFFIDSLQSHFTECIYQPKERQIQRWYNFAGQKGRKRRELVRECAEASTTFDEFTIDQKTRQGLQHWAYQLTKEDFDQIVADYDANGWPTGPVGDNNGALKQQRNKRNKSPNKARFQPLFLLDSKFLFDPSEKIAFFSLEKFNAITISISV